MPHIRVNDDVYRLIRRLAQAEIPEAGRRLADGDWEIPVADDMYELIDTARLPGESFGACITRLITPRMGGSQ